MSHETGPGMDDEFARRMRSGLAAMAPREVARTRRIRGRIAGGALGAFAIAVVTVLGVQVVGAGGQGGVEAVPTPTPTPSVTPTPEPSVDPTPEPTPTPTPDPEPTPPPGFEGVAAGVPVVVDTYDSTFGGYGDTGSAGGDEPVSVHDVYVLCRGAGTVTTPFDVVDCAAEAPLTVMAHIGIVTFDSEGGRPQVDLSADFTGTVRVVEDGQVPGGIGVGGVATAWVECPTTATIGDASFTCDWRQGTLLPAEVAAWGIPYGPDQLVPPIVLQEGGSAIIRLVLDPTP